VTVGDEEGAIGAQAARAMVAAPEATSFRAVRRRNVMGSPLLDMHTLSARPSVSKVLALGNRREFRGCCACSTHAMDIRHYDADAREPSHIHIVRPSRRRTQAVNGVQHECAERAFDAALDRKNRFQDCCWFAPECAL
jgi:hypothetical protein